MFLFLMYRVELKVGLEVWQTQRCISFLMYRVELKGKFADFDKARTGLFLMYRVELKVEGCPTADMTSPPVPNVPCGVERLDRIIAYYEGKDVPNVPCGVGSPLALFLGSLKSSRS